MEGDILVNHNVSFLTLYFFHFINCFIRWLSFLGIESLV